MKKLFIIPFLLMFLLGFNNVGSAQNSNCPDCPNSFSLADSFCTRIRIIQDGTDTYFVSDSIRACKNSIVTYSLGAGFDVCNYTGITYTVNTISNGAVVTLSGNQLTIQWGNNNFGSITISYSYFTPSGYQCTGTFTIYAVLANAPVASFAIAPNPACFTSPSTTINFNATATTNATQYYWDFGDGFQGTGITTSHNYTSAGNFCVKLIATSPSGISTNNGGTTGGNAGRPCAECTDTIVQCFNIDSKPGPPIDSCHGSVCPDETATYCTSASGCGTPVWTVTGGNISGGTIVSASPLVTTISGAACINVLWGSGNPQGTVNLQITGCPTYCGSGTTIQIPIIPATTTITGSNTACIGTAQSYSLPSWPGTTYNWSSSGGGTITSFNTNTPNVVVNWTSIGTFTLTCNYFDSSKNCGGTGTISVSVKPNMTITGTKIFCVSQSTTLNAVTQFSNSISATWNVSPAGTTYNPSGTSTTISSSTPGTYTVTANSASACNSASVNITVLAQPILGAISGPDSICPAQPNTYTITSNTSGTFNWTITNGTANYLTPDNSSAQITWGNSGPYAISVTQTSTLGNCVSVPVTKNVYPYPNPVLSGLTNVCADANVPYQIANIGNQAFNWYITPASFGTILSGQGSNQVTIKWHGNTSPGNTNTVYLHYGICNDDSIAVTINKPTPPSLTASGSLCLSGVSLTSSGTGTFSWSSPTNPYTSSSNPATGISIPGTYNVNINNYNGTGCNVSAAYNIPDIGRPSALVSASGVLNYCFPNLPNMNLVTPSGAGYSYQWYQTPGIPVGTNSPLLGVNNGAPGSVSINGIGNYSYYVVVTLNNCVVTSNTITIVVDSCVTSCNGKIDVTTITGCNPFTIGISASLPSGASIVPGSTIINYYDGSSPTIGNTTQVFDSIGYHQISICATLSLPGGGTTTCCLDTTVLVKIANKFLTNVNCGVVSLTDLSNVIPPCTINNHNWTVTDLALNPVSVGIASYNNNTIASPVLTITQSGTYVIHHTITGCSCSVTAKDTVVISVPNASFSVSNSCVGTPVVMNGLSFLSYLWDFGDAATSYTQNTTHAYSAAGNYIITHTVTDLNGCNDTKTANITIFPKPSCNITYAGLTTFCAGGNLVLSACAGLTGYQWYQNGNFIPGATNSSFAAIQTGNYYFTASNGNGCLVISDTVNITVTQPPSAALVSSGGTCEGDVYTLSIPPCNSCTFVWLDNNINVPGTNNSNSISINVTNTNLGSHNYTVIVTNASGCTNTGTLSVVFNSLPTISIIISPNAPTLCSGNTYALTANSNAASPAWAWTFNQSNFVFSTNPSILANAAGTYNVAVTNTQTGCKNSTSQIINASPDLSLFPQGCDTLCDTSKIFLPIGSLNGNINNYTINWYDNAPPYGTPIGTGTTLNLTGLPLGNHIFSVIVTDNNTGCVDTSNQYHVYIKSCPLTECSCSGSNWDSLQISLVPNPDLPINIPTLPTTFHCGDSLGTIACNSGLVLNAQYNCNPSSCDTSVTYQLNGPITQTGVLPFNFNGLPSGNYTLIMTGKCGDSICNKCQVTFSINCDTIPPKNCCNNSQWINGPVIKNKDNNQQTAINCGSGTQTPTVYNINNSLNNCNAGFLVSAGFSCADSTCPGTVKYELKDSATNTLIVSSINVPLTISNTLANGTYFVTLYGYCGDSLCKVCTFKIIKNCTQDCCANSIWTDLPKWNTTRIINGVSNTVVSPINCNESSFTISNAFGNCNTTTTVTAGFSCDTSCPSNVIYNLYSLPGNVLVTSVTGTLTIPPGLPNGNYAVTIYGKCGDKICDSCKFTFVKNCIDCCKGSKWLTGPFWVNGNTGVKTLIKCGVSRFNILNSNGLCFVPFKVNGTYACATGNCGSSVVYEIIDSATGNLMTTSVDSLIVPTSLVNGTYFVNIKAYCGGQLCSTCRFTIFKNCSCDCGPAINAISVNIITNGTKVNYKCGSQIPAILCTNNVQMTGSYACNQTGCPASYSYTLVGPFGTTSGTLPLQLNTLSPGTYSITIKAYCGGVLCKECTYNFTVLCSSTPPPCCPYNISVNNIEGNNTYQQLNTNSMLLNTEYNISGLTGVPITEIRAEVLSFNLSSNYQNECLKCLTYPANWASIYKGTFVPSVTFGGTINLFNGATTTLFNPTGNSLYQNPREIVWRNGGAVFTAPTSIKISHLLPPPPIIDCCELSGQICIKFTFRDNKCRECEVIRCINYKIDKYNNIIFAGD